ncbi:unnamed protein product [Dicrocoelium dendriticum]|nr:unnamed protein product [Dicrocoelium dendriticum]
MSEQAKILNEHNNEMISRIDGLCQKRDILQKSIIQIEEEKNRLQHDIRLLADKLAKVNETLSEKITIRNAYDKTIAESQAAYNKILDNSKMLLAWLRKDYDNTSTNVAKSSRI